MSKFIEVTQFFATNEAKMREVAGTFKKPVCYFICFVEFQSLLRDWRYTARNVLVLC